MSAGQAVLAIDLGTSSVKVLLVGKDGEIVGRGAKAYSVSRPRPGFAVQNPEDWWTATQEAVTQATASIGKRSIAGIGLSGQMHGMVLLGIDGNILRPAIIWEDSRSGPQIDEIERSVGRQAFIDITGSAVASGFQAASALWAQQHEPEIWGQTEQVLLPKDYLRFRLSGDYATEPSDASSTVMLDVRKRRWSSRVLESLTIDQSLLPEILPSDAISCRLSTSAALQLGLKAGIPIAGGAGDAPAAALACGAADSSTLLLTISSGSQAILATPQPVPDGLGRIHSWCHCLAPETGAGWYMMAATMASGMAMRWLSDNVLSSASSDVHDQLEEWAASVSPGSGGLLFIPYLAGERTPHMDPHARGMMIGLTAAHDRRHLTRAVMEGSAFALHEAYGVLASMTVPPDRIVLTGGGARSAIWTQIVADMFELPVYPSREADGSAMGAGILAGAAIGWFTALEGAARWQRISDPCDPRPEATSVYQELAAVYSSAYGKHREDFRILESAGKAP